MDNNDYRVDAACRNHDAGEAAAAIEHLTELLAEQPDNALYHGLLASCLLMQSRVVAAEYENSIALGLDPQLAFLHQVQARLLILKRKLKEALAACDESIRLDAESSACFLLKSTIYTLQERREEAKQCIDQAAILEPESVAVEVAYGDYYNRLGKHDVAYDHAAHALKLNPASDSANLLMGETQLALGNTNEADYHAKFAITQNPGSQAALRLFANIRMRNNWFIGAWWRFNSWIATLSSQKAALVLIGGFLGFNILSEVAADLGHAAISATLSYAWLILVLYSWVGLPMYHKAMARELRSFRFNPNF